MEEKIKEIVSAFTKVPVGDIGPATLVDRQAVKSSILLHRMYARLAEEGVVVENYTAIKTFSDLVGNHNKALPVASSIDRPPPPSSGDIGIGIDIEDLSTLPRTHDFRKDEFYTMNFTPSEIAYCVLQPDPYASFAGLFCAKEAIVKADGRHRPRAFNTIGITHDPEGRPSYPGFHLSISHAGGVAAAVAVPSKTEQAQVVSLQQPQQPSARQSKGAVWVGWLALLLSILAIILGLTR
ncbi:MAG: 4'-phosphopantetheinyl transferase superfamily protein [Chitinophagaceae bacterium]|nr:4'-phosphopantetheinyl transferase superfamily protein [Chitinophagaceae bacterium]